MINCKECGSEVDNKFKFSISKNICPVCGGSIFKKEKHEMLNYIIKSMSSQDFAKKISEDIISEISSFIFFEFLDVDDDEYEDMESDASRELSEYEESQLNEILDDDIAEDQQFDANSSSMKSEAAEEDVISKAERLKGIYQNDIKKMKPKTGVRVSRIST